MTNTQKFANRELEVLAQTDKDAVVLEFTKEILALCEAFGNSGQSGGSAPYVASAISSTLKKLMMQEPISEITGIDSEWDDVSDMMGKPMWQNNRCSALFKDSTGRAYYIKAIVWQGEDEYDTFTGSVYVDGRASELVSSTQYVKFPFTPKTFYVDVCEIPIDKSIAESEDIRYSKDRSGECYYTVVDDPKQLDEVFAYYEKK